MPGVRQEVRRDLLRGVLLGLSFLNSVERHLLSEYCNLSGVRLLLGVKTMRFLNLMSVDNIQNTRMYNISSNSYATVSYRFVNIALISYSCLSLKK